MNRRRRRSRRGGRVATSAPQSHPGTRRWTRARSASARRPTHMAAILAIGRSPATATEHAAQRSPDDAQIEAQALMAQVEEFVLELLERVDLGPPVVVLHLRPASQPRPDTVTQVVERDLLG